MPDREHEYDIMSGTDSRMGTVWWDGEKVDSDSERVLSILRKKSYNKTTIHDGVAFLKVLPKILKNGYISARRVNK